LNLGIKSIAESDIFLELVGFEVVTFVICDFWGVQVTLAALFAAGSLFHKTAFLVQWSEFPAKDPEVPGSIPGATRSSEK
jgi:hypothetical protein